MTDLLEQQLAATANPLDDSDWLAVRRLAPRPRPRVALLAAAAIAAALVAAPAFGLLDFIGGSPAPPEVKEYFADNNALRKRLFADEPAATHAMRERYVPVLVGQARGVAAVASPDGPIYLWAAPMLQGEGQCWLIQAGGDTATGRPFGTGACDEANPPRAIETGTFWTIERPNVQIVHGRVYDEAITSVKVELEGSEPVVLQVASGHALGTVGKDARVKGFVGLGADGEPVARSGD